MLTLWESTFGDASEKANGAPRSRKGPDREGPADYIATLVDELKSIAQAAGLSLIAYLLAMAKEEAQVERCVTIKG
jgi:hypothetical protein